jgi:hypothetical protein
MRASRAITRGRRDDRRPSGRIGRKVTTLTPATLVTLREFDQTFGAVKNWGSDDQLGTLNYLTSDEVVAGATLVRSGRQVSVAVPMSPSAGPDNPSPVLRYVAPGIPSQRACQAEELNRPLPSATVSAAAPVSPQPLSQLDKSRYILTGSSFEIHRES